MTEHFGDFSNGHSSKSVTLLLQHFPFPVQTYEAWDITNVIERRALQLAFKSAVEDKTHAQGALQAVHF